MSVSSIIILISNAKYWENELKSFNVGKRYPKMNTNMTRSAQFTNFHGRISQFNSYQFSVFTYSVAELQFLTGVFEGVCVYANVFESIKNINIKKNKYINIMLEKTIPMWILTWLYLLNLQTFRVEHHNLGLINHSYFYPTLWGWDVIFMEDILIFQFSDFH